MSFGRRGRWALAAAAMAAAVFTAVALNAPEPTPHVGEDAPATAMDLTVAPSNNSPALVADPGNDKFVVLANRIDWPDFSCALQASGDGGKSWIPIDPVPHLPEGAEKCYGSEAGFDGHGTLYFLFVGLAGNGNQPIGAFLTKSTDHGQTFTPPAKILGPHNFGVRLAVDPALGAHGRIQVAWLHSGEVPGLGGFPTTPNPIMSFYSDDGGQTFSDPVQVSPNGQRAAGPVLALGPNHRVNIGYYDLGQDARDYQGLEGPVWEGKWSLDVAVSSDGAKTFEAPRVVDGDIVPFERVMLIFTMPPPTMAAWGEHLCVGWADGRFGDPDVLVRCSTSHGKRWGAAVRVNGDPVGSGARQSLPRISAAPNGRLDVVYLDRDDPVRIHNETSYSYSTDGGHTFKTVRDIARNSSPIRIGPQYGVVSAAGLVEFGGRLGSLSRNDSAILAWPDTRNTPAQYKEQDIFFTRVSWERDGQLGWFIMLSLSAVVLVFFLIVFARSPVAVARSIRGAKVGAGSDRRAPGLGAEPTIV